MNDNHGQLESWEPSDEYERAFWAYAKASKALSEAKRLESAAADDDLAGEHGERDINLEMAAEERAIAAEAIASLDKLR